MNTRTIKISPFHESDLAGSDISNLRVDSGYSRQLTEQIAACRNGKLDLTAESLRDLTEFGEAMALGWAESGNTAGARSWHRLIDQCRALAQEIEIDA